MDGPLVCKDYDSTIDISPTFPMYGYGKSGRNVTHGVVCQLPDGRWVHR